MGISYDMDHQRAPGEDLLRFRHEALLYNGADDFVRRAVGFILAGVERGDPIMVAIDRVKTEHLQDMLGTDAEAVQFVAMERVGLNPARIIPVWREFIEAAGTEANHPRGIGEPIWAGRTTDELVEAEQHEVLLNLAFASGRPWWLLCPYDIGSLPPEVLRRATGTHPFVAQGGSTWESGAYEGDQAGAAPFTTRLSPPPAVRYEMSFDGSNLDAVRRFVAARALEYGLDQTRVSDLLLAVTELATNSVRHGHGAGIVRAWATEAAMVCEVHDHGHLMEPLAGRRRPGPGQESGIGLWLVNQLCDLVQIRSSSEGTTIRVHVYREPPRG